MGVCAGAFSARRRRGKSQGRPETPEAPRAGSCCLVARDRGTGRPAPADQAGAGWPVVPLGAARSTKAKDRHIYL